MEPDARTTPHGTAEHPWFTVRGGGIRVQGTKHATLELLGPHRNSRAVLCFHSINERATPLRE